MLFYAVQYLAHTISNTSGFITEYLDMLQEEEDGNRFCSLTKENAVKRRRIMFARTYYLVFTRTTGEPGNPINSLIIALLKLFEARYKVIEHKKTLEDVAKLPEAATQTVDLAAQLDTHIAVLRLFGGMMMLGREQWQDTGVVDKVALEGARPMPRRRKLRKLDLNIPIRAEGALDTGRPRASKRFTASTA
ncbi:hypothetical protein TRAPUB_12233 [Trametes pubescens]|uniref:Uncharacterized protein n=1 Tax=Trametes pubescens TaxID=154538 RepID=A0A1M2VUG2_TRAPU|nr:hypothetical protein TRAPUB_12233 [Trametes pubescens]